MKVSDITFRVRTLINDIDGIRWLDNELVSWINDAQKLVAMMRPDASVSIGAKTLDAGTKQTLPTGGLRLLDAIRNLGNDGIAAGRAIRIVDREVMDSTNEMWHTATTSAVIKNFIYDNRSPTFFYVNPPAIAGTKIEIMYSTAPAEIVYDGTNSGTITSSLATVLALSDIYLDAIVNYVLFRAYSKDAEYANNATLAGNYLSIVNSMLGIKTQKDAAYSPDLNSKGSLPTAALSVGGL